MRECNFANITGSNCDTVVSEPGSVGQKNTVRFVFQDYLAKIIV